MGYEAPVPEDRIDLRRPHRNEGSLPGRRTIGKHQPSAAPFQANRFWLGHNLATETFSNVHSVLTSTGFMEHKGDGLLRSRVFIAIEVTVQGFAER